MMEEVADYSTTLPPDETLDSAVEGEAGGPALVMALVCSEPLEVPIRLSLAEVDEVVIGRGPRTTFRRDGQDRHPTLRIDVADLWMSSSHARLVNRGDSWWLVDAGSKNGTTLNGARVDEAPLDEGDQIEAGQTFFWFETSCPARGDRSAPVDPSEAAGALATVNGRLQLEFRRLRQVARSDIPVLLLGETGTGKEVVARAIHEVSRRRGPLVAINCGALPESLIEAELFGCQKGAYTGATENRPGLIRAANGGTLFLDEVAELPRASQVAFLRVLQEQEVVPVGDTQPIPVDIRVIAATHQELSQWAEAGRFRKDLFARLAGFEMTLPPLRHRREDIGLLIGRLLTRIAPDRASSVRIQPAAARILLQYDWPLNIRELENALRSALSLSKRGQLSVAHLPETLRAEYEPANPSGDDQRQRQELMTLFRRHGGNVSAVARALSTSRGQVRRLCRRFGIDPGSFRL